MRLIWVPLLILEACTTDPSGPETKKASFNLKEACAKSEYYSVGEEPTTWSANIEWIGPDETLHKDPVDISWGVKGFQLPCGYGVQGDPKPIFTITYQ